MSWLYRIQQHVAITATECLALLCIGGLFTIGLTVRFIQSKNSNVTEGMYAEADALFEEKTSAMVEALAPETRLTSATEALADTLPNAVSSTDTLRDERPSTTPSDARMNLNTASSAQLQRLTGIGPALAERIIAHRDLHGPFRTVEEIIKVRGIGPRTLENIAPMLFVDQPGDSD